MPLSNDIYEKNLDLFYSAIDKNYDDRTNTKKWCLTVWLAIVVFIGKNGQSMSLLTATILSLIPIIIFWFLEATQGAYGKILIDKALEMEQYLLDNWEGIKNPQQYLYLHGRHAPMKVKAKATIHAMFAMESVITFYILLAAVTPFFLYFIR